MASPTKITRYGASEEQIESLMSEWNEPKYRAEQIWACLYRPDPLSEATTLPAALKNRLVDALPLALDAMTVVHGQDGMTSKWLWAAGADRAEIETVLMRTTSRATVCVSSQAGCAMGCTFCATGQAGFNRQLSSAEIVEQVVRAAHGSPQRVSNVVYMGMGEPLANYETVWDSVERIHSDLKISARRITLSTVGIVPAMLQLAKEALPITLAVSLHAANDSLRQTMIPLNNRYPIADILDAAAEVAGAHGRRVTFEYACIEGVNDSPDSGRELAHLLGRWPGAGGAHVNLIPLNPTTEFFGRRSSRRHLEGFAELLRAGGVSATIRRPRGVDIDAACGQLRSRIVSFNPK